MGSHSLVCEDAAARVFDQQPSLSTAYFAREAAVKYAWIARHKAIWPIAQNLLARNFSPEAPDQTWTSDIEFGVSSYHFKRLLGIEMIATSVYYRHRIPLINWILRKLRFFWSPVKKNCAKLNQSEAARKRPPCKTMLST